MTAATSEGDHRAVSVVLHASCVAVEGRAVLITGCSGSGTSSLALSLMAYGATLVADDRTIVDRAGPALVASAPATIHGLIEARGVGLLCAETVASAHVMLVVDLDQLESDRLPEDRKTTLLGCDLPLLHKVESPHFPSAVLQYLKMGRKAEVR